MSRTHVHLISFQIENDKIFQIDDWHYEIEMQIKNDIDELVHEQGMHVLHALRFVWKEYNMQPDDFYEHLIPLMEKNMSSWKRNS